MTEMLATDQAHAVANDWKATKNRCRRRRLRILEMSQKVSALHIAGAFSCLELVDAVYFHLMKGNVKTKQKDTFVLSKGHGSLAQYTALEELGILTKSDLDQYCKVGGILGTHPDYGNAGIEASTGSLGHGLPIALGMAMADKIRNEDRTIFVVMSDGELQEGSVWEALMLAPSFGLNNLIAVVDLNDFQSLGRTSRTHPNFYPVVEKIEAFGWQCIQVDGHDSERIVKAIGDRSGSRPFCLIGKTIKGKGVSYMENEPIWHYRSPNANEYQVAVKELMEAQG